jgi:hypothetical protein
MTRARQITLGFDKEVNVEQVAKLLRAAYDNVEVGQGITVNGLSDNSIYVHNKGKRNVR